MKLIRRGVRASCSNLAPSVPESEILGIFKIEKRNCKNPLAGHENTSKGGGEQQVGKETVKETMAYGPVSEIAHRMERAAKRNKKELSAKREEFTTEKHFRRGKRKKKGGGWVTRRCNLREHQVKNFSR